MTEKSIVLLSGGRPLVKKQREALAPHNAELRIARQPTEEVLMEEIQDVDVLIPGSEATVSRQVIEAGEKLKGIVKPATGYENIDIQAATENGIYVTYLPNYAIASVAEHTFSLILTVARRIRQADRIMRRGKYQKENWFSQPPEVLGVELVRKTLGIIGLGKIGKAVAERANGFNMEILEIYWDVVSASFSS